MVHMMHLSVGGDYWHILMSSLPSIILSPQALYTQQPVGQVCTYSIAQILSVNNA